MPMKSQAQRRALWAMDPEMAKEWERHTPKGKKLPERVAESLIDEWGIFKKPTTTAKPSSASSMSDDQLKAGNRADAQTRKGLDLAKISDPETFIQSVDVTLSKIDKQVKSFESDIENIRQATVRLSSKPHLVQGVKDSFAKAKINADKLANSIDGSRKSIVDMKKDFVGIQQALQAAGKGSGTVAKSGEMATGPSDQRAKFRATTPVGELPQKNADQPKVQLNVDPEMSNEFVKGEYPPDEEIDRLNKITISKRRAAERSMGMEPTPEKKIKGILKKAKDMTQPERDKFTMDRIQKMQNPKKKGTITVDPNMKPSFSDEGAS